MRLNNTFYYIDTSALLGNTPTVEFNESEVKKYIINQLTQKDIET